jgi:hypothetical protein
LILCHHWHRAIFGRAQICCPREGEWDSGAGAVNSPDLHGISQRRILMRTDFAVGMPCDASISLQQAFNKGWQRSLTLT